MTSRENMLAALRGDPVAWTPIVAWVDNYNQPSREGMPAELAEQLGDRHALHPEAVVRMSRWLGLEIMDRVDAPFRTHRRQVTVITEAGAAAGRTVVRWQTPAGELREVIQSEPSQGTSARLEHLVKGPADLAALAALFEDERYEIDAARLAAIDERRKLVSDDGVLVCFLPGTPLGMMYRAFCSVETLAYLHVDAPAALDDLLAVMESRYRQQFELTAAAKVDALVTMDDTSTTTISPTMFAHCNMAVTDARAAIAHTAGKLYLHHSCGLIRGLLPLYRETAMDSVHFHTPPPLGDATVADGLRLLRDNQSTIPLLTQLFGAMDDLATVRRSVEEMFAEARGGARFVPVLIADPLKTAAQTKVLAEMALAAREEGAG